VTSLPRPGESPSDDIAPELMQRCHESICESQRGFARILPDGHIEEEPGVVKVAGGLPLREFNTVFISQPPLDAAKVIERSASFMARAGVSAWRVVALPGTEPVVGAAALSAGLRPGKVAPGMILARIPARPPALPAKLRIRRATSLDLWVKMVKVGLIGFGGEAPDDTEAHFPFRLAAVFRGYVGFVEGVPVATSVGLSYRGIGSVFFVSTLPESRGNGFGSALTWQASVDARREGCRVGYLQATELGRPVYTQMGFRTVAAYPEWHAP
jgi:ribosomal protein S18 acetylase RimI-like enzyme